MIHKLLDSYPDLNDTSLHILTGLFPWGIKGLSMLPYHFWNLDHLIISDQIKEEAHLDLPLLDRFFSLQLIETLKTINKTMDDLKLEAFMDPYFKDKDLNCLILNCFLLGELKTFSSIMSECEVVVKSFSPDLLKFYKKSINFK